MEAGWAGPGGQEEITCDSNSAWLEFAGAVFPPLGQLTPETAAEKQ